MNMGSMFIRYMPWELQEKVGDGTATAAVMFQSIYKLSWLRIINSGGNSMFMRTFFDRCVPLLHGELGASTPR